MTSTITLEMVEALLESDRPDLAERWFHALHENSGTLVGTARLLAYTPYSGAPGEPDKRSALRAMAFEAAYNVGLWHEGEMRQLRPQSSNEGLAAAIAKAGKRVYAAAGIVRDLAVRAGVNEGDLPPGVKR